MVKNQHNRNLLREIVFWVILVGVDTLLMYWCHTSVPNYNGGYMSVMSIMLSIGATALLIVAGLRYIPKDKRGIRLLGFIVSLALGVGIGQFAAHGFYGEPPFILEAIYGKCIENYPPDDLNEITITLYEDGKSTGKALPMSGRLEWYQGIHNDIIDPWDYRAVRGDSPVTSEYALMHLFYKNGRERNLRLSETERWGYIEESGISTWRREKTDNAPYSQYAFWKEAYIEEEFNIAFLAPYITGKTPTLSENYNGREKVAWISRERNPLNEMETATSWDDSIWIDYDIPEGYTAERATDVRWLFVKDEISNHLYGYEVVQRTGQYVRDIYKSVYIIKVYDLVTGESKELTPKVSTNTDSFDIGACMREYLDSDSK